MLGFVISPTLDSLFLLQYIGILLLAIHLPFIFGIIGGTNLSVFFNILDKKMPNPKSRRFSQDIITQITIHPIIGILLGILPIVVLTLIFFQFLYGVPNKVIQIWLWAAILVQAISIGFIYGYQKVWKYRSQHFLLQLGLGGAGLLCLAIGYFLFLANKNWLLYPEYWFIEVIPISLCFSSNLIPSFLGFISLALVATGAWIFIRFRHGCFDMENPQEKSYVQFCHQIGTITVSIGVIIQPIAGLLDVILLPKVAMSWAVIACYMANVVAAMCICLTLVRQFDKIACYKWITMFVLLQIGIYIGYDHLTRTNALQEQLAVLDRVAKQNMPQFNKPKGSINFISEGKEVYEIHCMACHSIDGQKGLGPSFKGSYGSKRIVASKGLEHEADMDEAYLHNSIINPSQDIVRGFPNVMPALNLTEHEVDVVCTFIQSLR